MKQESKKENLLFLNGHRFADSGECAKLCANTNEATVVKREFQKHMEHTQEVKGN